MFSLESTYAIDKDALTEQYVKAWRTDEVFQRQDALREGMLAYAATLEGQAHPIIKARCFEYLTQNARVYVNPNDPFGIALEVPKLDPLLDIGCHYQKPIMELNRKWTRELDGVLNRAEDKHFADNARGALLNEFYIDYNHSTPCWEDIFALGVSGIRQRAREYRKKHEPLSKEKLAYFDGIEITYTALLNLLDRYIAALDGYECPRARTMRQAIVSVKDAPPKSTYEALLLAWIFWFAGEQIDGIRVRSMGALDRLYYGFYKNDTDSGVLTRESAVELFTYFMSTFHAQRVVYQQPMYIGGVDEDGACVVNELSFIVLDAYNRLGAPNPKLQAIVSKNTPDEFLRRVLETVRAGNSSISIINHDIAEAALLKFGVTLGEARTYLMSGCWDYAVKNHEVKTVPIRVSLPKILEYTLTGGMCLTKNEKVGIEVCEGVKTFEDFVAAYEKQWLYIQKRAMSIIENWETHLAEISPANLFSGSVTDSLERGADGYASGMKYNNTVYCVCGLATLVDSLCAIKKLVFDEKRFTLGELTEVLKSNWESHPTVREQILHDPDKYGNGSPLADSLSASLVDFFAKNTNLRPNSRGSFWKLGILSIDKNVRFGALMCATPDGRLAGEPISKNLSPVIGMDRGGITVLMNSLSKIDFTNFPHSGMLDATLHPSAVEGEDGLTAFTALVRTYFAKGGHSIQFNVFSAQTLIEAQKYPDKYKNLQVRVCGWNVYFVDLEKTLQDAFIKDALHQEGVGKNR